MSAITLTDLIIQVFNDLSKVLTNLDMNQMSAITWTNLIIRVFNESVLQNLPDTIPLRTLQSDNAEKNPSPSRPDNAEENHGIMCTCKNNMGGGNLILRDDPSVIKYGFDFNDSQYVLSEYQGQLFNSVIAHYHPFHFSSETESPKE